MATDTTRDFLGIRFARGYGATSPPSPEALRRDKVRAPGALLHRVFPGCAYVCSFAVITAPPFKAVCLYRNKRVMQEETV